MSSDDKTRDPDGSPETGDAQPEVAGGEPVAREPAKRETAPEAPVPAVEEAGAEAAALIEPTETKPAVADEPSYYDDPFSDDAYNYDNDSPEAEEQAVVKAEPESSNTTPPPLGPTTDLDDDEEDEEGMARMSFLEHLEELRTRIVRAFIGLLVAYVACLAFAKELFELFAAPFARAAEKLPYDPPLTLVQLTPTEQFMLEYFKLPLLAGIFLGAPWLMYQAWSFIAPGLYKKERRWAGPFIFTTAGLFIGGGLFCYFIALRFALAFLIGLGYDVNVRPMISLSSYYDMFFNLHVGLGAVFQMPIVIFFFTLLRITTPGFLIRNGRYAILIIFVIAAVITPTPDVTTMLTFAMPMVLLYYVGIAASYLIIMKREGKSFPWKGFILLMLGIAAVIAAGIAMMHYQFSWEFTPNFPWMQAGPGSAV